MDFSLIANSGIMLRVNSAFLKGFAMAKESLFQVRVICYQGYRGEETPRRFYLGERQVEVAEIVDRWISPEHRYFKLLSPENDLYILRHESIEGHWELTLFESRSNPRELVLSRNGPFS